MAVDSSEWRLVPASIELLSQIHLWFDQLSLGWKHSDLIEKINQPGYYVIAAIKQSFDAAKDSNVADSSVGGVLLAQTIADETTLLAVAVNPMHYRCGLGRKMVDSLAVYAKSAGSSAVFLEVRESNYPAIKLYESLQFERVGARKNYYSVIPDRSASNAIGEVHSVSAKEDALLFRKRL